MRCLNCGNENPPDNIYCNECGARLQDMENADLAVESSTGANVDPGVASAATPAMESSAASSPEMYSAGQGGETYPAHGSGATQEHEQPDGPVVFVPATSTSGDGLSATDTGGATDTAHGAEEHSHAMSTSGDQDSHDMHESSVASAGDVADSMGSAQDAAVADDGQDAHGVALESAGAGSTGLDSSPSMVADHQDVPLTEDTMAPTMEEGATAESVHTGIDEGMAATTGGGGASMSMPDVIPMAEAEEHAPVVASYDEVSPAASGTPSMPPMPDMAQATPASAPTSGAGNGQWAAQALHQLEDAQQAMARGDWAGFGISLGNLRSFLEGIRDNSAPSMGGQSGASSADTYQTQQASGSAVGGNGVSAGQGVSSDSVAPTLEPAAEAGSLGAVAPAATSPSSGASAAEQSGYVPAVSTGAGAGVARLVVISTGAELPLPEQEEITVGREDPSSGIFPDVDLTPYGGEEGGVSRRHARLLCIGDDYYVEDLQSTNYTKLDGQRLPAHVRERLEDSARLDFGRVAVIFRRS